MQTMFCEMQQACATNQIDCNFIREMIPHHVGAVQMANNAFLYPICPELAPILESIIQTQNTGILKLRSLLQCMRCQ